MNAGIRLLAGLACLLCAVAAEAAFHQFRIEQMFTNADGSVQFVVLHESFGANGENLWNGQALLATPAGGAARAFVFPNNLPSGSTANRRVLVATPGFAALGVVTPDYTMPAGFLPFPGGTLSYAGVHTVTYTALPTDGTHALTAAGTVVANVATNFAGASGSVVAGPPSALAVEFYHQGFDHYFVTHHADEIAILDAGVAIKGWTRTGQSFNVYAASGTGTSPVCRFRIPPEKGDSHFYGRGTAECDETAAKFPTFINEDPQFFHVVLPALGVCPAGSIPVYRVFSGRADANHRYMIDRALRDQMVNDRHWIAEGDGPDLVVMCVPPLVAAQAPPTPAPPEGDPMPPGNPYYP
ncbi:MAG: hypothetical protein U1F15_06765 [Burkholderiales bacterium]